MPATQTDARGPGRYGPGLMPYQSRPSRLEKLAIRTYAELGIHSRVFAIPAVRRHALALVRRLVASGFDPADCMTRAMADAERRDIQRMACVVRKLVAKSH